MVGVFWMRTILTAVIVIMTFLPEIAVANEGSVTPIIFASTGHKSCKKDKDKRRNSPYNTSLHPEIEAVIDTWQDVYHEIDPIVIHACFEYGVQPFGGRQVFKYTMNNNAIGTVEMGEKALLDQIDYEYIEPAIDAAIMRITEAIDSTGDHVLYLVGHSWGGWLTMKLATLLPDNVKIAGLVTLDPVSPLDCWPNQYIRLGPGYIKNCRQAPSDIDFDEQQDILERVQGEWNHYFQRQFYFAQSGPIESLEDQIRSFKLRVTRWTINHHTKLQEDDVIWDNFLGLMQRTLL